MPQDLEANKKNAIAFYRTAYLGSQSKQSNSMSVRNTFNTIP